MKVKRALDVFFMGAIVSLMFVSLTAVLQQEAVAQSTPQSHFRGNHIEWTPAGALSATFDATWSSRASGCFPPPGGSYSGGIAPGHICREFTGVTDLSFGDGTTSATFSPGGDPVWIEVVFVDSVNDFITGEVVDPNTCTADASDDLILDGSCSPWTHSYAASGPGPYTAGMNSCCRTSAEINNPGDFYDVDTLVDFNTPPQPNSSPTTSQQAIQQCPQNAVCQYQLPIADANGDTLNVRLSTLGEWGGTFQPGEAGSAGTCANPLSVSSSGLVTWDTTGCGLGLYSTSQRIEEFKPAAGTPHGFIMVDYLIEIGQQVGNPPAFDVPPMSPDNTVFPATVGVPIVLPVSCTDPDGGDTVTLGNLGLPSASVTAQVGANPGTQTLTYTAVAPGIQIVSLTCSDNNGNNAPVHDYIFDSTSVPAVGGKSLSIDTTALILAGAQTNAVWIMSALAVIGSVAFGALYITTKKN